MWGNDGKDGSSRPGNKAASTVDTLIGRQSEINGDVHFTGGLHVDGRIRGKVTADSDDKAVLSLSESGAVEGDVHVPHVVLNGTVDGNVYASQRIVLSAKARINGDVHYKLIEMTGGAMINGQMIYEGDDKVAAIPHKKTGEDESPGTGDGGRASIVGAAREKR